MTETDTETIQTIGQSETRTLMLATGMQITTDRPVIELAEYQRLAEAAGRRYQCPTCGNVAAVTDWPDGERHRAAQECIGRAIPGTGCDWAAFGLLGSPKQLLVRMVDDTIVEAFPLAEAT